MSAEARASLAALEGRDAFVRRHIGPGDADIARMLDALALGSLDEMVERTVPRRIRNKKALALPAAESERGALKRLAAHAERNQLFTSLIGMGYADTITPTVILRNVLENPGWYTAYTPYQAEIAQGRLEALLNFQTMICDLTGMEVANASLLDEGTAAAEAMTMARRAHKGESHAFFVAADCHPQTIEVMRTRAKPLGIELIVGNTAGAEVFAGKPFAILLQYPTTTGAVPDYAALIEGAHKAGALVIVATDLLALVLLAPPGAFGADIVVGNSQRFGVPLGFGGPHAAFLACRDALKRTMPGRLVGLSVDGKGRPGLRLALQTREQHIRREKATSNICTAQVLLAVMASMYAVYHGPEGLKRIAGRVHRLAVILADGLKALGFRLRHEAFFDTLAVAVDGADAVLARARAKRINLRRIDAETVGVALDETTTRAEVAALFEVFSGRAGHGLAVEALDAKARDAIPARLRRTSAFLAHPVFNRYHSETEMLRYLHRLQEKDVTLTRSMIPLGSCTMKLNATSEMIPVTWPGFAGLHPFAPAEQTEGYVAMIGELAKWLAEITGMDAVSMQPNAGSQGEYTGLLTIRAYHAARGEGRRDVCLIPSSAHGTNPASAVMAGLRVVVVGCDEHGNVDLADLKAKTGAHKADLAALMITYPSTHGVFEEGIVDICRIVHANGGQVYMDGANLNALVGLCRPGEFGPDVMHLNLHKTFCIPHGGGGPGMGPIAAKAHLAPHLPGHGLRPDCGPKGGITAVSAAPWGSPAILPISWVYIAMMGPEGLKKASQVAILNANYVARRLSPHFPVLYTGANGMVAHECIIDLRPLEHDSGITAEDVSKRLMDFGFHAPTMSFPVAGTLMIEPTESESKEELDRFCEAMIAIRSEIAAVIDGRFDREDNPLKRAPHTLDDLVAEKWDRKYGREQAAYPLPWVRERKYWPPVGRIDNVYGDRNLVCACPPVEAYAHAAE
ncbi:MAG: aminomethyl-transferring glycine dehydrogenase [Proteobacteria bacterium]|nr:aminomethyl-transferring glycine dehydrogenase [Pseudomonadota bacterium]